MKKINKSVWIVPDDMSLKQARPYLSHGDLVMKESTIYVYNSDGIFFAYIQDSDFDEIIN